MEVVTTIHPPRTIREVYDRLPEGTLAQLIEDQLVMSPAPTYNHQDILLDLGAQLRQYVLDTSIGVIIISPFDVHLSPGNVYQPDIIFVSKENFNNLSNDAMYGAPDLVIELLSPSTSRYDQNQKKAVYEKSGVSEYWIVDPDNKEALGYILKEGCYESPITTTGKINSEILGEEFKF